MKLLLIHGYRRPDDGAFIRVKNLNSAIVALTEADSLEVVLISLRRFRQVFYKDDHRIFEKRYILPILWTNKHLLARIWNRTISSVLGLYFALCFRPDLIVGENISPWFLAHSVQRWLKRSKLVMDLHGSVPEERFLTNTSSRLLKLSEIPESGMERDIVYRSTALTCQSEEMIVHLKQKYPGLEIPMHSFQCSVQTDMFQYDQSARTLIRRSLNVKDDEILFVYSGSLAKWQRIDYAVEVFAEYLRLSDRPAKFLILTGDSVDKIHEIISSQRVGRESIIIKNVLHHTVPSYLSAADMGFLIREDIVVNRVASPTKLGEYLSCGLPVVVCEVAKYWKVTSIDPFCFCFVELGDSHSAALSIIEFLFQWTHNPSRSRSEASRLASMVLSNKDEIDRLYTFLRKEVLSQ